MELPMWASETLLLSSSITGVEDRDLVYRRDRIEIAW